MSWYTNGYYKDKNMKSQSIHYHSQDPACNPPLFIAQTAGIRTASNSPAPAQFYQNNRTTSQYISNGAFQSPIKESAESPSISPKRIPQTQIVESPLYSYNHPSVVARSRRYDVYTDLESGPHEQATRRSMRKDEVRPQNASSSDGKRCCVIFAILMGVILMTAGILFGLWKLGILQNGKDFISGGNPTVANQVPPNSNLTVASAIPKATTTNTNLTVTSAVPKASAVNTGATSQPLVNSVQPITASPVVAPTATNKGLTTNTAVNPVPVASPTPITVKVVQKVSTTPKKSAPTANATSGTAPAPTNTTLPTTKVTPIAPTSPINTTSTTPTVKATPAPTPTNTTLPATKVTPIAPPSINATLPTIKVTPISPAATNTTVSPTKIAPVPPKTSTNTTATAPAPTVSANGTKIA